MENNDENYDPGTDQNQGVVGTMARNQEHQDAESDATQVPQLDPNLAVGAVEGTTESAGGNLNTDDLGERKYVNDEGVN